MNRKGKKGKTKLWRSDGRGRNHKFGPRKMEIHHAMALCFCAVCNPISLEIIRQKEGFLKAQIEQLNKEKENVSRMG